MHSKILNSFNSSDTLAIISPYLESGENRRGYSVARYTGLLVNSFPKTQKVVIFCESRLSKKPHLASENVLIVPSYKVNSFTFLKDLVLKLSEFDKVKNILVQFEFSIFGGKIVIPQFLGLLLLLKIMDKSVKISFHQVVSDINTLSGHLAIERNSLKSHILNFLLRMFYVISCSLSDKVFVHDQVLAKRIIQFTTKSKIVVISHGAEAARELGKTLSNSSRKYFGVDKKTKLVGIFGYCSWYKGTDWLIENFARFAEKNKDIKIRLIVAGGESPTLRGTSAYKKYHERLKGVIKNANGNIIYTGFIPEKDVKKVFAACDLMVFPYRTKMSASGAFSLCAGYKKPFIASDEFSKSLNNLGKANNVFSLNYESFEVCLLKNLDSDKSFDWLPSESETWESAAKKYLDESLHEAGAESKLEYAEVLQ